MLLRLSLLWLVVSTAAATVLQTTPTQSTLPTLAPGCVQWYEVQETDTCVTIAQLHHISISAFVEMNPGLDRHCRPLYTGYTYCVRMDHMVSSKPPAPSAFCASVLQGCSSI